MALTSHFSPERLFLSKKGQLKGFQTVTEIGEQLPYLVIRLRGDFFDCQVPRSWIEKNSPSVLNGKADVLALPVIEYDVVVSARTT